MKRVFVTVGVADVASKKDGFTIHALSRWTTLLMDENDPNFDRIVGDSAALLGQKALLGHLRATPAREGGRG